MTKARLAAILAVALGTLTFAAAVYSTIANFPRGLILAALLIGAATAGWYGLIRRGAPRIAGLGCAALLVLASLLVVILDGGVPEAILVGAAALGAITAAKAAVTIHVPLAERGRPGPSGAVLQPEVRGRKGGAVQARRARRGHEA